MRNNMHENWETSAVSHRIGDRSGKAICCTPDRNAVEGSDRACSTYEAAEQRGPAPRRRWWREERGPRRTLWNSTRARHRAGKSVSQGLRGVREVQKFRFDAIIQGKSRMR